MQLTSTMKPFEVGDIFLGCTYLNNPDADPFDRSDKRWFIAPAYIADGRLLCTVAEGLRIYDERGKTTKNIPLPGYGWAQVTPDVGFAAPHRSLAGIAVYAGQGSWP